MNGPRYNDCEVKESRRLKRPGKYVAIHLYLSKNQIKKLGGEFKKCHKIRVDNGDLGCVGLPVGRYMSKTVYDEKEKEYIKRAGSIDVLMLCTPVIVQWIEFRKILTRLSRTKKCKGNSNYGQGIVLQTAELAPGLPGGSAKRKICSKLQAFEYLRQPNVVKGAPGAIMQTPRGINPFSGVYQPAPRSVEWLGDNPALYRGLGIRGGRSYGPFRGRGSGFFDKLKSGLKSSLGQTLLNAGQSLIPDKYRGYVQAGREALGVGMGVGGDISNDILSM